MDINQKVMEAIISVISADELNVKREMRELGINSIKFIQIIVNLEAELGIEVPDESLYFEEGATVEDLCRNIKKTYLESCFGHPG